jgi:hypothetical protein
MSRSYTSSPPTLLASIGVLWDCILLSEHWIQILIVVTCLIGNIVLCCDSPVLELLPSLLPGKGGSLKTKVRCENVAYDMWQFICIHQPTEITASGREELELHLTADLAGWRTCHSCVGYCPLWGILVNVTFHEFDQLLFQDIVRILTASYYFISCSISSYQWK